MKLLSLLFIHCLIAFSNKILCFYKITYFRTLNFANSINIFIMTHKDFYNTRNNQIYKIVVDDETQLKNKYNLQVIYADKGKLYQKRKSYAEMSKLYYIYELYKNGTLSSKYIGLNHYRRYFNFLDNIPDLDKLFENNDIILSNKINFRINLKKQYCSCTFCNPLEEVIKIIKEKKHEYYQTAIESLNAKDGYFKNMFIMKKLDFFKYCEFIYDILFEFDRRHNFTSDEDIINYLGNYYPKNLISHHLRIQGFLSERLSSIFFKHNFKRIKTFPIAKLNTKLTEDKARKNKKKNFFNLNKYNFFFFLLLITCIILIIKIKLILNNNINYKIIIK